MMAKEKEADISTQMFLLKLRTAVRKAGGSAEAGRVWGVAPQHIGSALSGAKLPAKRILEVMGYEPVIKILYRYKALEGDK